MLKVRADECGIEVPIWLGENAGNDDVQTSGSKPAAFRPADWVVESNSILEEANEALTKKPPNNIAQRWEFVFKGKKESSEKVKDKLREFQESLMVILLIVITGVPILKGRIEDHIKSKEGAPGLSADAALPSNEERVDSDDRPR